MARVEGFGGCRTSFASQVANLFCPAVSVLPVKRIISICETLVEIDVTGIIQQNFAVPVRSKLDQSPLRNVF